MFVISGKVAWTREESLASIVSVEMVDLPLSKIQAEMEDFGTRGGESFYLCKQQWETFKFSVVLPQWLI